MRNKLNKVLAAGLAYAALSGSAWAANYVIDDAQKGAHASINFKIKHLGYSWLQGRFDRFDGKFEYDKAQPEQAKISVQIATDSVNTNHAERDKHLRSGDFLNASKFPQAKFESTSVKQLEGNKLEVNGQFTLNGVTKALTIMAEKVGEGKDPWGNYRAGFSGTTEFALKDYGIETDLGPASTHVLLELHVEGIRQ